MAGSFATECFNHGSVGMLVLLAGLAASAIHTPLLLLTLIAALVTGLASVALHFKAVAQSRVTTKSLLQQQATKKPSAIPFPPSATTQHSNMTGSTCSSALRTSPASDSLLDPLLSPQPSTSLGGKDLQGSGGMTCSHPIGDQHGRCNTDKEQELASDMLQCKLSSPGVGVADTADAQPQDSCSAGMEQEHDKQHTAALGHELGLVSQQASQLSMPYSIPQKASQLSMVPQQPLQLSRQSVLVEREGEGESEEEEEEVDECFVPHKVICITDIDIHRVHQQLEKALTTGPSGYCYDITVMDDGHALDHMDDMERPAEVVLLDLAIHRCLQTIRYIRSLWSEEQLPIMVMMPAKTHQSSLDDIIQAGANSYIHIPYTPAELQVRVAEHINARQAESALLHAKEWYLEPMREVPGTYDRSSKGNSVALKYRTVPNLPDVVAGLSADNLQRARQDNSSPLPTAPKGGFSSPLPVGAKGTAPGMPVTRNGAGNSRSNDGQQQLMPVVHTVGHNRVVAAAAGMGVTVKEDVHRGSAHMGDHTISKGGVIKDALQPTWCDPCTVKDVGDLGWTHSSGAQSVLLGVPQEPFSSSSQILHSKESHGNHSNSNVDHSPHSPVKSQQVSEADLTTNISMGSGPEWFPAAVGNVRMKSGHSQQDKSQ